MSDAPPDFGALVGDIRARVHRSQRRAVHAANRELLLLYWDVGRLIDTRQRAQGWGAGVIPRLAQDLKRALPEHRGFSERNLLRMVRFHGAYPELAELSEILEVGPQPVAQLPPGLGIGAEIPEISPQAVAKLGVNAMDLLSLPWGHHLLVLERAAPEDRAWYITQAVAEGWSRDTLGLMLKSAAHRRQGAAVTNFAASLPAAQSDLARQALKDPYVFDFLTLEAPFRERELELGLVRHLERFLLELGVGFAFVGRQHRLVAGGDEFFLDLLFYHLRLRCFVVVDLKVGPFQPEHAGKMNFYLNVVDDQLKHATDAPSIGLILCQDKNQVVAEYALRGMDRPIGVSAYELTRALPPALASALPTIDALEAELSGGLEAEP